MAGEPGPSTSLPHELLGLASLLLGWRLIAWLWQKNATSKLAALAASAVWLLIALAVIGALPAHPTQQSVQAKAPPRATARPRPTATPLPSTPVPEAGSVRVGSWAVRLTGYYFTARNPRSLPSSRMEWLVTHWHLQNESHSPADLTDLDFSARTGGLLEAPHPSLVGPFGYHGMPGSGLARPGDLVKGTEIIPVFKGRSSVTVRFLASAGSAHMQSHTWTITR